MKKQEWEYIFGIVIILLIGTLVYGYVIYAEQRDVWETDQTKLEEYITQLEDELSDAEDENHDLRDALEEEQDRLRDLGEKVEEATDTISDLEKLSQLDEELLKKYSKVSFLNENYIPERLSDIGSKYLYDKSRDMQILKYVERFLEDMIEDADDDGVTLLVRSAYRSFGTQAAVKTGYVVTYGAGTANTFSAEQGFSEHQLGTTVDFTTEDMNGGLTVAFENTEAFEWLEDNAHKYGFVLSYPKGNAYYQYEPWHWRFVGRDLARYLDKKNKYFYDLDQREIDEYLLDIFN